MDNARQLMLALDTSMPISSAALLDGISVVNSSLWRADRRHSMHLEPNVRAVVGAELDHVGTVAVAAGPGGFSSLRTSMAFAKGLCGGMRIRLSSVSSSLALAYSAPVSAEWIISLIPTVRDHYFAQTFRRRKTQTVPSGEKDTGAIEILSPCKSFHYKVLHELLSGPTVLVGHVDEMHLAIMKQASKWPIQFEDNLSAIGLARFVGLVASQTQKDVGLMTTITAVPEYLRGTGVTAPGAG